MSALVLFFCSLVTKSSNDRQNANSKLAYAYFMVLQTKIHLKCFVPKKDFQFTLWY